jgi:threonyl-tRNA synthetase
LIDSDVPIQLPDFLVERNQVFEELKNQHAKALASKPRRSVNVTFDTGVGDAAKSALEVSAKTWETTPGHLLKHVPKEIASEAVVAKVNSTLWDLSRPLEEEDCKISYLSIKDPEGRAVFWHSAAHLLGEAAEYEYGCLLSHGPPTAAGFFYDMALEPGRAIKESDWPSLEANAKKFSKEKQPFERLEVSKEDLRKLFAYSKYKMHFVEKFVPDGGSSTVYRNGDLVDLCLGPHIQNTKQISAFKIMNNGSAYFLGDQANDSLQRVYGVAFPKAEQMKEWETFLKEAKARDHQEIGKQQKLFWFSQLSPGSPFLLPHGTRIFNAIQAMLREQYWERDYDEVHSPLMYDVELWKTSGHWKHYQDDMFRVPVKTSNPAASTLPENVTATNIDGAPAENKDKGLFALKPMNCPGHCLMFSSEERSYRTLPWRVADFSVLHRNEASGALSGLTRVRKFQQDDAHIFCTVDQVTGELQGMFDFMTYVYALFGFPFKLKLSTRPDSYMGKLGDWDAAEEQLKQALQGFRGDDWVLNPGDGAFYGPKIDVTVNDAMGREFQCATIQLDFQLPQNFNLQYRASEAGPPAKSEAQSEGGLAPGMARPVMIHRAVIGSFDRFLAVICEHFAGKWPFWLSPRQIMVIPIMKEVEGYSREVQLLFRKAKMYVDTDLTGNTLPKKIRNAQVAQYNFILVVGAQERDNRAVNIRNRDDPATQQKGAMMQLDEALKKITELRDERRLVNAIEMK